MPEGGLIAEKLERLPRSPGVYLFRDAHGTVIYVGKARSLRPRVRSYFQEKNTPDPKRDALVAKIADLDVVVTDSEIEALLLENNLIKQHAPRYNIRLKDDKSYPYIVVTGEPFPRVFPTRNRRNDGSRYFGPYTDVKAMHLLLRTIRGIFPIRSCDFHLDEETIARRKYSVCLDYHIRKCEGPCEGLVSREEYGEQIRQVVELLKGRTRAVQAMLEEEMRRHAEGMAFEKAAVLRNRLLALQKYRERQKVVATDGADRDIIAAASSGADAVGVVLRVREGNIVGKRHLAFAGADGETPASILAQVVQRYYPAADDVPPELLFPEEPDDAPLLAAWLRSIAGVDAAFVVPKIGEKAKLVRMCSTNASYLLGELVLQKMKADDTLPKSVAALQADLRLPAPPRRIECFDISHFQGSETVASMVSFLDGKARKSEYRKYRIADVEGVDDFASMREVVHRRYARQLDEQRELPDLVVIDGGKGQLSAAKESLDALGLAGLRVIGLAKRLEEVFVPGESAPYSIARTSPGLRLLQRVRDEAHRFAVTFHRERRSKATLQTELEQIEGVGPKRAALLLETFGSVRGVREATPEQLAGHVGWSCARAIADWFATVILLLAVLLSAAASSANAQRIADPALHALVARSIEAAGHQRYAEARAALTEAMQRYPEHPAGYLQQAVLLEVVSLDCETPVPQPEFSSLLDRARERAERMLERDPKSADGNYYLGMVHSYIAYYKFRDGENWISGLRHGMTANAYLARCLQRQPGACDAMTAAGTYKYWKSRKMSLLTWTPLVDDERAAGIAMLRRAESCALYSAAQAVNSLVWIYIEEERWDDAIRAARRMLARYPGNRLFLWGVASAAEKKGDARVAIDAYREIVRSIDGELRETRYIAIQARAKIARLSFERGDRATARAECAWVLANRSVPLDRFTPDGRDRIERRIADMEDLRDELGS